jgi:hypothetical protein
MVQLHAIQELWDLFSVDDQFQDVDQQLAAEFNAHLCVCLSAAATSGIESIHSMRLEGVIQGHAMVILINSGSSHTFVSSKVALQLSGTSPLDNALAVQVANGYALSCEG